MQDLSYLPNLIDEDIYVIKEAVEIQALPVLEDKAEESNTDLNNRVDNTIVDQSIPAEESIVEEPAEVYIKPLPTEGSNLKHCIVIVESSETILDSDSKSFLANILKSVKRSMDDILLVNAAAASDEQIQALLAEQNHRHLICFGSEKLAFLKSVESYSVHSENHKYYLKSDGLDLINKTQDKKKALWSALKEMFL